MSIDDENPEGSSAEGAGSEATKQFHLDPSEFSFCQIDWDKSISRNRSLRTRLQDDNTFGWADLMRLLAHSIILKNPGGAPRECGPEESLYGFFEHIVNERQLPAQYLLELKKQTTNMWVRAEHVKDVPPPGLVAAIIQTLELPNQSRLALHLRAAEYISQHRRGRTVSLVNLVEQGFLPAGTAKGSRGKDARGSPEKDREIDGDQPATQSSPEREEVLHMDDEPANFSFCLIDQKKLQPRLFRADVSYIPWPSLMQLLSQCVTLKEGPNGPLKKCTPEEALHGFLDHIATEQDFSAEDRAQLAKQCKKLDEPKLHKEDKPPPGFAAAVIRTLELEDDSLLAQHLLASEDFTLYGRAAENDDGDVWTERVARARAGEHGASTLRHEQTRLARELTPVPDPKAGPGDRRDRFKHILGKAAAVRARARGESAPTV